MRVTMQQIVDKIKGATYTLLPDGRTTVCQLTLANGFTVTGESACVDLAEYNRHIGEKYAYEAAVDNVWKFEGYLLAEKMSAPPVDLPRICHEVNKAYCEALGDFSQPHWEDAPDWQKASAQAGVLLHATGSHGPQASHESWMKQKTDEGWVYGPVKDPEKKQHPCMVPFDQLPREQQAKDYIFRAVVNAVLTSSLRT